MKKEKSSATIFATAFIISLSALLIVVMIILSAIFLSDKNSSEEESVDLSMSYYRPEKEDLFRILLIQCTERSAPPYAYTVLEINPHDVSLTMVKIPPETEVTIGFRTDTLDGQYDYAGCNNAKLGAENILLTKIDRYIRIDQNGFANLIDVLGGFEKTISAPYKSDTLTLSIGKNLLNGKAVLKLLKNTPNEVFSSEEEFFKEWFLQKFNSDIISKSDYLFTVLLNNVDTDITQFDYLSCKKPLKYLLEAEKINFSLKKYKKTGA